jgi:hypothetical protein
MLAERRAAVGDLPDHGEDGARHVLSRPLGGRRRLPAAPAEPDAAGQLAGEELHLLACTLRASAVVEALGLGELVAQLVQAAPVRAARVRVEDVARVAEIGGAEARLYRHARGAGDRSPASPPPRSRDVELAAGMREQRREVREALRVLQPDRSATVRDRPVLALLP